MSYHGPRVTAVKFIPQHLPPQCVYGFYFQPCLKHVCFCFVIDRVKAAGAPGTPHASALKDHAFHSEIFDLKRNIHLPNIRQQTSSYRRRKIDVVCALFMNASIYLITTKRLRPCLVESLILSYLIIYNSQTLYREKVSLRCRLHHDPAGSGVGQTDNPATIDDFTNELPSFHSFNVVAGSF